MPFIRFGGVNLPKGMSTWYMHINPDGNVGGQVFVYPGDEVDEARVQNAQHYIDCEQAIRIDRSTSEGTSD